jgi:transcriptional regulator with GAF, ATPase, and Fis domain
MSANTQAKILRVLQEHEFERLGGWCAARRAPARN